MTANEWEKRVKCGYGAYPPGTEYEAIIADLRRAEENAKDYRADWIREMTLRLSADDEVVKSKRLYRAFKDEVDRLCKALEDKRGAE